MPKSKPIHFHEDNTLLGFCQVCREITAEGFFFDNHAAEAALLLKEVIK